MLRSTMSRNAAAVAYRRKRCARRDRSRHRATKRGTCPTRCSMHDGLNVLFQGNAPAMSTSVSVNRIAIDLDGVLTEHPAPLAAAANQRFKLDLPERAFI